MSRIFSEVIIVGAGSAGCAAAIQLKRSGMDPLLFEKDQIGGLANNAYSIENYLGFPDGITGVNFVDLLKKHLFLLEIKLIKEEIIEINWNSKKNTYFINSNLKIYESNYLILATGTVPKKTSILGEEELIKRKLLFFEPIKIQKEDIINKKIAIIGGGDAAFDYALNLEELAAHITIFNRTNSFQCLPILFKRVRQKKKKITIKINKRIVKFGYKEFQNSPIQAELEFADNSKAYFNIVLIAIGRNPNSFLINNLSEENVEKQGLFIIGDLKNKSYRQISLAASDGIKCAMKIVKEKNF